MDLQGPCLLGDPIYVMGLSGLTTVTIQLHSLLSDSPGHFSLLPSSPGHTSLHEALPWTPPLVSSSKQTSPHSEIKRTGSLELSCDRRIHFPTWKLPGGPTTPLGSPPPSLS